MKKHFKTLIIVAIILFVIFYLSFAFVIADLNSLNWTLDERLILVTTVLTVELIWLCVWLGYNQDKL